MSEGVASLETSTSGEYRNVMTKQDWFSAWVTRLDREGRAQDIMFETASIPIMHPVVLYVGIVIIVVPGIVGNVLLFLISRSPELSVHPYSLYLSGISIADSAALLTTYTEYVLRVNGFIMQREYPNIHWCRSVQMFSKTAITVSPWLLVCFSLDRYVALVFPLKKKVFCTYRNARIMVAMVVVLCFITQVAMAFQVDFIRFQGSFLCAAIEADAFLVLQIEFGINTLVPVLAMLFLNTHSLIAVKMGIAERMHLNRASAGESARVSRDGRERRRQGAARQQAETGKGRGRTHGENGGPGDTDHDTPTGQPRAGKGRTATTGLWSQESRVQSAERHGEATGGTLDREDTGRQADRGEAATSGTEQEPKDVEQGSLSQSGRERGLKADGSNKDRARGPTSRGNGEDVGRERNPGRRREDPANGQSEIRRMSRALLSIPFFSFLCMIPYAFLNTTIWFSMSVASGREIEMTLQIAEPYFRLLFTMSFAANFYLLVGTSKRYRDIAWKVVRQWCGRRHH